MTPNKPARTAVNGCIVLLLLSVNRCLNEGGLVMGARRLIEMTTENDL
jgi:hypothetical protein